MNSVRISSRTRIVSGRGWRESPCAIRNWITIGRSAISEMRGKSSHEVIAYAPDSQSSSCRHFCQLERVVPSLRQALVGDDDGLAVACSEVDGVEFMVR